MAAIISTPNAPFELDADTVGPHLVDRRLVRGGEALRIETLTGGVSGSVLLVESADRRWVVKQALPRLRVARDWYANPVRTVVEATALQLASAAIPGQVPEVVDIDPETNVLVMTAAPTGATDWKSQLLCSVIDPAVGWELGILLGRLHGGLRTGTPGLDALSRSDLFEELRVDPFFRSLTSDNPHLAEVVMPHVERMSEIQECLVHGDFSAKNVLVAANLIWLLDFEVAHVGDPAFDVAFMLTHLILKGLHVPLVRSALACTAMEFLTAYERSGPRPAPEPAHVVGLIGCLLLARVDGRSPAEYLRPKDAVLARALGTRLAATPGDDLRGIVRESIL